MINTQTRLCFSDLKPLEKGQILDSLKLELLKNLSIDFILQKLSTINSIKEEISHDSFFSGFFTANNNSAELCYKYLKNDRTKNDRIIVDKLVILHLMEYVINQPSDFFTSQYSIHDQEMAIFYCILIQNEIVTKKEKKGKDRIEATEGLSSKQKIVFSAIIISLPNSFINLDLKLYCQIIKAGYLFDFLAKNEDFRPHLTLIFDDYKSTKQELFWEILNLGLCVINRNKSDSGFLMEKFLNSLNFETKDDFIKLKDHPILKTTSGYVPSHPIFLIEKIYKTWYFEIIRLNGWKLKDKNSDTFRSELTKKFSEEFLLNEAIKHLEENQKARIKGYSEKEIIEKFKLTGDLKNSLPDYVLKQGNNIFILENKDAFFRGKIKHEYDFDIFEEEINKKINFVDQDGKNKHGIPQLLESIKLLQNPSKPWKDCYTEQTNIYPVIVLHDDIYDHTAGLNYYLNQKLQERLIQMNINGNIKPLLVLTIDSLLVLGSVLKENPKLNFSYFVNSYFEEILEKELLPLSFLNFLTIKGYFNTYNTDFFKNQIRNLTGLAIE